MAYIQDDESTDISGSVTPCSPLVKMCPLFSQFLGKGYKLIGLNDYPIPVITSHPEGEWMDTEYK